MGNLFLAMGCLFVLNVIVVIYLLCLTSHVNDMVDIVNSISEAVDNHANVLNQLKDYVNMQADTINSITKLDREFEEEYNKLVDSFNRLSEYTMAISDLAESQYDTLIELEASGEIKIPQENRNEIVKAEDRINELYKKLEEDFELVGVNEHGC